MSTKSLIWLGIILAAFVGIVFWYTLTPGTPAPVQQAAPQEQSAGIANPASVNCVATLGGQLEIVNDEASGGEVGYCHLPDGRVCEEWGLMRDNTCNPPPQK